MILLVDGRAVEITLTEEISNASSPTVKMTLTPIPVMANEKTTEPTLVATKNK